MRAEDAALRIVQIVPRGRQVLARRCLCDSEVGRAVSPLDVCCLSIFMALSASDQLCQALLLGLKVRGGTGGKAAKRVSTTEKHPFQFALANLTFIINYGVVMRQLMSLTDVFQG